MKKHYKINILGYKKTIFIEKSRNFSSKMRVQTFGIKADEILGIKGQNSLEFIDCMQTGRNTLGRVFENDKLEL